MADRGFKIDEELKQLKVNLKILAFLGARNQLTKAEVKESQTIASVRIHVERAISRIKKFQIIRNEIPLTFHGICHHLFKTVRFMHRDVSRTLANSKMKLL